MHPLPDFDVSCRLEKAFLSLLIAIGANAMWRLSGCHIWLKAVSDRTGSKTLHFVTLLLSFPVFQVDNLLFKFSYAPSVRRPCILSREQALLRFKNKSLELDFYAIDGGLRFGSVQSLNEVLHRLETAKSRCDFA